MNPHPYIESDTIVGRCFFCNLPEVHMNHNTRPVRKNPRTRRLEYTD